MKLQILCLSVCFMAFIFPSTSSDLNWWCNQTPHPEPCKYHHNHRLFSTISSSSISRNQFLNWAIQVAMDEAHNALNRTKWLLANSQSGPEKAALADCTQFYDDTVFQLNRTQVFTLIEPPPTAFDIQTWLSAALTNIEYCKNGFTDLNLAKTILPLLSTNLTQLISNTLAINILAVPNSTHNDHKQTWAISSLDEDPSFPQSPDAVVAKDGSGNFTTIKEALDSSLKRGHRKSFLIHLKQGIYNEYLELTKDMTNIIMVGDGLKNTIITGSRSTSAGYTTYESATLKVIGDGFIAKDITFQNTAGPQKGQAVALVSRSDHSVFYRCGFLGYQDTLCVWSQRQLFQQCAISGTIDFIWGNAAVVLQNCTISVRKPLYGEEPVIAAQGRTNPNQTTGISIQGSKIMAGPDLAPVLGEYSKAYLGRPWQKYSRTVYMESFLDGLIDPAGWLQRGSDPRILRTLFYGEYKNFGPGSVTSKRVKWPGYRVITEIETAEKFTVAELIGGQSWLPRTNVPFFSGL